MTKGFKFKVCRNGHPYNSFGIIRANGRWKGIQRCILCTKDSGFRQNEKRKEERKRGKNVRNN